MVSRSFFMRLTCVLALPIISLTGCGALISILDESTTKVQMINPGDYNVDVTIYTSEDQNVLEAVLTSIGNESDYNVPANDSITFAMDCDELQAIIIDKAEISITGDIGPDQQSDVLRDGSDFNCGDTITFTFDYAAIPTELEIDVNVSG